MTTTDSVQSWSSKLSVALDVLLSPGEYLKPFPEAEVGESLGLLLDLRHRLQVNELLIDPLRDAADRFGSRCGGASRRELLTDLSLDLLWHLDAGISKSLENGIADDRVFRSADFGELRTLAFLNADRDSRGIPCHLILFAGVVPSLPPGHRLHNLLPSDDYFDVDGTGRLPSLVLGRPVATLGGDSGPARKFYLLDSVRRLTEVHRQRQRDDLAARREAERLEAVRRRQQWENSPLGRLELAQQQLQ